MKSKPEVTVTPTLPLRRIPVAAPTLVGNEKKYVLDCLDTTWISSNGKYIERFEESFASFCGVKHAIACCNGTVALHLALLALDVGPGDEVILPTLTYVATANAVMYCGARPVFIDSEPTTWNIDPDLVERAVSSRTRAIIVVHLYGHPVDMDPILEVARKHGIEVIEDAAEAHGAEYKGRRIGSLGEINTFSFYGNKIITTGEGGMVTTNNDDLARKVRQLKGQGQDFERRYWFPIVGYNYRMTNIEAAIGLGQLEQADLLISRHREIAAWYRQQLWGIDNLTLQIEQAWAKNVYWMNCVVLGDHFPCSRDATMAALAEMGIETRPFFYPMHILPMYLSLAAGVEFPVADRLSQQGINLPSSANLTLEDVVYVGEVLNALARA